MQEAINKTWQFDQSPEEVWEYLTQPELIEQWLMKNDFQPIIGHKFRFTFDSKPEGTYKGGVDCEVLEVNPHSKLSYTWNGGTNDGSRSFNSKVVWTLIPKANGTELQLQHDGFTVLEDILTHSGGWDSCIKRLGELINNHN